MLEEEKTRTFIALDVPENIKKEIIKIQKLIPRFEGKLTEIDNLHLTLKFLGHIDKEILIETKRRLKEIKIKQFQAEISEVGVFSLSRIKIVWLKMRNCNNLQRNIDSKLSGLFPKERRFMGHITIARVKHVKNQSFFISQLKKIKISANLRFTVKSFELMKSTLSRSGPVYENLKTYNLQQ